jgi:hypothetical protein
MFCAPRLYFNSTEAVGARFHFLRYRNLFGCYRGRRVPFSCFALPDSFSTVLRASGLIFMFCDPEIFSGGAEGVGAHFQILRSPTSFRRYRGCRGSFSCFALPDSFWVVPRAPGPFFLFYASKLVSSGTKGVGNRFHILRSPTRFQQYQGRRGSISCFELPY